LVERVDEAFALVDRQEVFEWEYWFGLLVCLIENHRLSVDNFLQKYQSLKISMGHSSWISNNPVFEGLHPRVFRVEVRVYQIRPGVFLLRKLFCHKQFAGYEYGKPAMVHHRRSVHPELTVADVFLFEVGRSRKAAQQEIKWQFCSSRFFSENFHEPPAG
jgi:hypothetical protein